MRQGPTVVANGRRAALSTKSTCALSMSSAPIAITGGGFGFAGFGAALSESRMSEKFIVPSGRTTMRPYGPSNRTSAKVNSPLKIETSWKLMYNSRHASSVCPSRSATRRLSTVRESAKGFTPTRDTVTSRCSTALACFTSARFTIPGATKKPSIAYTATSTASVMSAMRHQRRGRTACMFFQPTTGAEVAPYMNYREPIAGSRCGMTIDSITTPRDVVIECVVIPHRLPAIGSRQLPSRLAPAAARDLTAPSSARTS